VKDESCLATRANQCGRLCLEREDHEGDKRPLPRQSALRNDVKLALESSWNRWEIERTIITPHIYRDCLPKVDIAKEHHVIFILSISTFFNPDTATPNSSRIWR
jgi:hypothetical protein